jgi:N utilization substance protein B
MRAERRRAREAAMRALYQVDLSGCAAEWAVQCALDQSQDLELTEQGKSFAAQLVRGSSEHKREIDSIMADVAHDWSVGRMSPTDRNIMRIAVYEMLHLEDVPIATSIDEAVEIAKIYGSADSPRFVNGILGSLAERLKRQAADSLKEGGSDTAR